MNIQRENYNPIKKEKITSFIDYNTIDLDFITSLLNQVIHEYTYSTFDLIQLVKDNFNGDFKKAINNIHDYSKVRFNCYYATKLLKEKLSKHGIDTKYVSYKSIGFSSNYGDELIKEAHMSLVIPTIRDYHIYYIILDPGYRIPSPICFYKSSNTTNIKIDNDYLTIQKNDDNLYPYSMKMQGYNRYSLNETSCFCEEYFNCDYETLNPEEILFPLSFEVLNGYRMINYNEDKKKCAMLKVMILDHYLQCSEYNQNISLTFSELLEIPKDKLHSILKPFCDKLNQDVTEFMEILYFILETDKQFVDEIINKKVLDEFQGQKLLTTN